MIDVGHLRSHGPQRVGLKEWANERPYTAGGLGFGVVRLYVFITVLLLRVFHDISILWPTDTGPVILRAASQRRTPLIDRRADTRLRDQTWQHGARSTASVNIAWQTVKII
ncbi:hypothetical protein ACIREE_38795 [Streptomyces sp. NPDC102467]|uniref:hypothetical protein n=1 Tax=Streptomyces sp. NPDC102467 TaxID=3366179 RepID=UPI003803FDEE